MNSTDFDGTLVLEKLAEIDKIDEFFDAVDSDNFEEAIALMRLARIDKETISLVIEQMKSTHGVTLK